MVLWNAFRLIRSLSISIQHGRVFKCFAKNFFPSEISSLKLLFSAARLWSRWLFFSAFGARGDIERLFFLIA